MKTLASSTSLALIIGLSLSSCGAKESASDPKIVGGTKVSSKSELTKYTVSLIEPGTRDAFCTGTLIDRRHVVTAAHCLVDLPFKPVIGFGTSARTATRVRASAAIANPDFDQVNVESDNPTGPINDIGLVSLSEDAPASAIPAAVLDSSTNLVEGEDFVLAGFGITSAATGAGSGTLRTVTTKISAVAKTRKEIEFGGKPGKSACNGDSGGPAFVMRAGKLMLTGVTSRGSADCTEEGIYTDIRFFRDWISESKTTLAGMAQ